MKSNIKKSRNASVPQSESRSASAPQSESRNASVPQSESRNASVPQTPSQAAARTHELMKLINREQDLYGAAARSEIGEIADCAENTNIYRLHGAGARERVRGMSAWETWEYMLRRIAGTKNKLAAVAQVVWYMPSVREKLK